MAMTTCRECGKDVAEDAKKCPHCGVETPYKLYYWAKIGFNVFLWIMIGWLIFSGTGLAIIRSVLGATTHACKVHEVDIKSDLFMSKGEFDAGYVMTAIVERTGKAGNVNVNYELSTSQGVIERTVTFRLEPGQRYALDAQFPEPTIEAENIRGKVNCDTM